MKSFKRPPSPISAPDVEIDFGSRLSAIRADSCAVWRKFNATGRTTSARPSAIAELRDGLAKLQRERDTRLDQVDGATFSAGDKTEDIAKAVADHAPTISPAKLANVAHLLLLRIAERRKAQRGD